MGAGYTRQSAVEIQSGQDILADPLNNEFNAIQAAFNSSTGHTHDGTSGEGPLINLLTSITGVLPQINGGIGAKHKVNATIAPGVNDDATTGYGPGSIWIDITNDKVYVCVDATTAQAVWKQMFALDTTGRIGQHDLGVPVNYDTVADLVADTELSYSAGANKVVVVADDLVIAGGWVYKVAASGASDHNITTAGSVKLYVSEVHNNGQISPMAFGATAVEDGDISGGTLSTASSNQAIQNCWVWAAANNHKVIMDKPFNGGGQLYLPDNLHCEWLQDCWLYQTDYSTYGGFIVTRSGSNNETRFKQNIRLVNPQIDGQFYPAPQQFTVVTGTSNTTFTLDASASAVDNAYNGLLCLFIDGTADGDSTVINGTTSGFILDYTGSTKEVILSAGLGGAGGDSAYVPPTGATCLIGYNDLAIGFSAFNSSIVGGKIRNYPFSEHIEHQKGAKAINTEQGAYNLSISGLEIENCGFGIYIQGISWEDSSNQDFHKVYPSGSIVALSAGGTSSVTINSSGASATDDYYKGLWAYIYATADHTSQWIYRRRISAYNGTTKVVTFDHPLDASVSATNGIIIGVPKRSSLINVNDIRVVNGGPAIAVMGTEPTYDDDSFDNMCIISNVICENVGHAPLRVTGTGQQKAGAIMLHGGANATISNVTIRNDDFYPDVSPGYSDLTQYQVGYGLSGPIGAIIWGTGRNVNIKDVNFHGDCDAMIQINRARAIGRDGTPASAFRMDMENIKHYGTADYVISTGAGAGDAAPSSANLKGVWKNIVPDTFTSFGDGSGNSYTNVIVEIRDIATNKTVLGTIEDVLALTDFSDNQASIANENRVEQTFAAAQFKSYSLTLADDTAGNIPAPYSRGVTQQSGILVVADNLGLAGDLIGYRAGTSLGMFKIGGSSAYNNNVTVTTSTTLTGTTGTDVRINLSAKSDGTIDVENRLGSTKTITVTFLT